MYNIYLDNAATTKPDPKVLEVMMPYLTKQYGNPSSIHELGQQAKSAIEKARAQVAGAINASPSQIFFTSGATESNNWVLHNFSTIICSKMEHHSILNNPNCRKMNDEPLAKQIRDTFHTQLVTHMLVNNETGEIYNVKEMCDISHKMGVPFHTDATAAFGHTPVDVVDLDVDYLSLSGHKFHAPKGVGILYAKNPESLHPMMYGGGQERGRRGGTESVPLIIAIGEAAERFNYSKSNEDNNCHKQKHIIKMISEIKDTLIITPSNSIPNTVCFAVKDINAENVVLLLSQKGIYVSSGSACSSNSGASSNTLKAMGIPEDYLFGAIRISFDNQTSMKDLATAVNEITSTINMIRGYI